MKPTGIDDNASAAWKSVIRLIDAIVHLAFQDDDTFQFAMPVADGGFIGKK
jgi:hypothetical protein